MKLPGRARNPRAGGIVPPPPAAYALSLRFTVEARAQIKWKLACGVLATLLVLTNAWWFYGALDAGVTQTYREQVLLEREQQVKQLRSIANRYASGRPLSEVKRLLGSLNPLEDMFEKDGRLVVGYLSVEIGPGETVKSFVTDHE